MLQYPEGIAGNWHKHFNNHHSLVLELACGKGEYTVGLARLYPQKNFTGVDVKGNRIWVGAKKALSENLVNVAFLRAQIERLPEFFCKDEVDEIWITFPDPQLRYSKAKKRLTHPRFLRLYQKILKPGGRIHLKTDSPHLYRFTKEVLNRYHCTIVTDLDNVYAQPAVSAELSIKTHYEGLDVAQSSRIHYLCFTLPDYLGGTEEDEALKQAINYELEK